MQNIFLIGMPGAGKTEVGKVLSDSLNMAYTDIDNEIEAFCKMSIPLIFEKKGEAYFRELEKKILSEKACEINIVISTGGGSILDNDNQLILKSKGKVIYLRAECDSLFDRIQDTRTRPLLKSDDLDIKAKLMLLFSERSELYENLSDMIIDTDGLSVSEVAEKIKKQLKYDDY